MVIDYPPVYRFGDLRVGDDLGGYDFSVGLVRPFVLEVLKAFIDVDIRRHFQEIGEDIIAKCGERYVRNSYSFCDDTLLVNNFSLGREGRWLNVPSSDVEFFCRGKDNYLIYSSHNIDSSHDRNALQTLFTTWVDYVPTVLGMLKQ